MPHDRLHQTLSVGDAVDVLLDDILKTGDRGTITALHEDVCLCECETQGTRAVVPTSRVQKVL